MDREIEKALFAKALDKVKLHLKEKRIDDAIRSLEYLKKEILEIDELAVNVETSLSDLLPMQAATALSKFGVYQLRHLFNYGDLSDLAKISGIDNGYIELCRNLVIKYRRLR